MPAVPPLAPVALGRRQAGLALLASALGLGACGEPAEQIVPYVEQPERVVPGVPLRFATTLTLNGYGRGVVATTFEGRPVKLEGNAEHPASLGATDAFAEAAILELYDPDRSRAVRENARVTSRERFGDALASRLGAAGRDGGAGLRVLSGHLTSPTLLRLMAELRDRFPAMHWHAHQPLGEENALEGARLAHGRPLAALPQLERAAVVLALDADPLGPGPEQLRHARAFADRRTVRRSAGHRDVPAAGFSRFYSAEPVMTATGAKADHRLASTPDGVRNLAVALAARLGVAPEVAAAALPPAAARFLDAAAADLLAHPGEALVLVGPWQPPGVHALAHRINARLGAPVDLLEPVGPPAEGGPETLAALVAALRDDAVETLVVLGANPAHDAPAAMGFADALRGSRAVGIHLGPYRDETAALCRWHLPESHPLEEWADARAPDGTASIAQPLIRPLHDTVSAPWLLGAMLGRPDTTARAEVRATWEARKPVPTAEFAAWWQRVLHDGVVAGSAAAPVQVPDPGPPSPAADAAAADGDAANGDAAGGLTLVLRPDASVWDGRFANNAWLQECPRPLTRQVWGNAVLLAPAEGRKRGLRDGDLVRLSVDGRGVEAPVLLLAGTASGVAALSLGYGRARAGSIGDDLGADGYVLRRADLSWGGPVTLEKTGRAGEVLRPTRAHRLEGEARDLFRGFDLAALAERDAPPPARPPSLMPEKAADTHAWAMVIDATLCIGCNACVVACQSENNVPVVGPAEVARGRHMHWLRIDTYEMGPGEMSPGEMGPGGATPGGADADAAEADPRPGFQPVPCMHCEHAPCEPVCPVTASVHDGEGLNVQVYNRCIGTRFCQANCPYKVRRFNWFGYNDGQEYANLGDPLVAAQHNPEVSVRARGVMEKCTYCTQRISAARRAAEREHREVREGEVRTACQSACPARAISFGDLNQPESAVSALRGEPQHYALLGELGTRPRTTYLGAVRNPNPALKGEA